MALIACRECGKEISNKAATCPPPATVTDTTRHSGLRAGLPSISRKSPMWMVSCRIRRLARPSALVHSACHVPDFLVSMVSMTWGLPKDIFATCPFRPRAQHGSCASSEAQ